MSEIDWSKNTNFRHPGMLRIYFACFIAFLNSAINGYDNSLFGGMVVLQSFKNSFNNGEALDETNPDLLAIMIAMIQIGSAIGSFFVGSLADGYGRRAAMIFGSVVIILGTILEIITDSATFYMAGRALIGFGIVFVTSSAPTYTIEIAHPSFRGRAGAIYNTGWNVGAIPASCVLFAMAFYDTSSFAWKLPCALQAVFSGIVLVGALVIPESPRWLMAKGREDEARQFLIRHHGNDIPDHPIVEKTMNEIRDALEEEKRRDGSSYISLFTGRPMLYRMFILLCVAFFSQYAGNFIAGYFQATVTKYFGVTSTSATLGLGIITGVISFISSQFGAAFVDKLGRRVMLFYGSVSFVVCYAVIIGSLWYYNDQPDRIGAAIFAYVVLQIFAIAYSFVWTPLNSLYPAEILPYSSRAKGMALLQLLINAAGALQQYVLSKGINAYKYKFFSFYMVFNILACIVIWFFFVETKGRTLESIDEIFESTNPVKRSLELTQNNETEGGMEAGNKK